jgi:hypothetical protein
MITSSRRKLVQQWNSSLCEESRFNLCKIIPKECSIATPQGGAKGALISRAFHSKGITKHEDLQDFFSPYHKSKRLDA